MGSEVEVIDVHHDGDDEEREDEERDAQADEAIFQKARGLPIKGLREEIG
jgi:hypothetical protein